MARRVEQQKTLIFILPQKYPKLARFFNNVDISLRESKDRERIGRNGRIVGLGKDFLQSIVVDSARRLFVFQHYSR